MDDGSAELEEGADGSADAAVDRLVHGLSGAVVDALDVALAVIRADGRLLTSNRPWDFALAQRRESCVPGEDFFGLCRRLHAAGVQSGLPVASLVQRALDAPDGGADLVAPAWSHRDTLARFTARRVAGAGAPRVTLTVSLLQHGGDTLVGGGPEADAGQPPRDRGQPALDPAQPVLRDRVESERLALVARHTDDGVVIYGPDGRIAWVNDAFVRMSGFGPSEVVGHTRTELIRGPFTRQPEFEDLAAELEAMRGASAEFVTRTKGGVPYWVAMDVRPVFEDGHLVGLVGVERDVSARRQAEERAKQTLRRAESLGVALRHEKHLLTMVLGTIPHVVWWKNADLRYVGANEAFLAWRSLRSQAEVVGRLEGQLDVTDDIGPQLAVLEAQVAQSREPEVDATITVTRQDDEGRERQRTYLVSVLPHLENGRFAGVIGIGADVSQVTELERQLAQASRLESIGQLAAGIAHEINTPVQYVSDNTRFVAESFQGVLGGLGALADLTRSEPTPSAEDLMTRLRNVVDSLDLGFVAEEVPSALSQSMEGLERVAQIVKAMKDFSHPGTGRVLTDLNRAVETTVQVSRNEWKYLAELDLALDPEVGQVPCFEGELKQVVLNIVVNAAQAVQERRARDPQAPPGRIRVSTRAFSDEVWVAVQDNGTGMDDATVARIFDPFFTTKDVGQGTGQGLSLAHGIVVQKHGGRIEVDSTPGEGSTFTVVLPRRAAEPLQVMTGEAS